MLPNAGEVMRPFWRLAKSTGIVEAVIFNEGDGDDVMTGMNCLMLFGEEDETIREEEERCTSGTPNCSSGKEFNGSVFSFFSVDALISLSGAQIKAGSACPGRVILMTRLLVFDEEEEEEAQILEKIQSTHEKDEEGDDVDRFKDVND